MAYKPRLPSPFAVRDLTPSREIGKYEITRDGITYRMPLELTRSLRHYFAGWDFRTQPGKTVHTWYAELPLEERKMVERLGELPAPPQDFWPDAD